METVHAKNGVAKNAKNVQPATNGVPAVNGRTEPKTDAVKPATDEQKENLKNRIEQFKPEPLTAEGRITRMQHFEALSKRYQQLKEKANDLKMFKAGNDKTNAKIVFENSQGFDFEIVNTNVIEKLRALAEDELNIMLKDTESEVINFEI